MFKIINEHEFVKSFEIRPNNFSIEGRRALFSYLEDLEESTNEKIELDVIAVCCDYREFKNVEEYLDNNYSTELKKDDFDKIEEFWEAVEEEINDKTSLIKFEEDLNEGFIIQQF